MQTEIWRPLSVTTKQSVPIKAYNIKYTTSRNRSQNIGGFKGEAGEALPPQIFLTLKFVVCIAVKIIEIVATWCDILGLKGSKFDFGWGSTPDPARGARSAPRPPADPILALGPPGLETTCFPKYVSLNPPMSQNTQTDTSHVVYYKIQLYTWTHSDLHASTRGEQIGLQSLAVQTVRSLLGELERCKLPYDTWIIQFNSNCIFNRK